MIEISNDPNSIVEDILPYLTNRLPKLVTGCVSCLASIIENFGCKIISPKPIVPCLSKLFAHADKNVRNETTKLTIELYRWMGDALINALFSDLKPVQQKDLTAAFEKEKGTSPQQKDIPKSKEKKLKEENKRRRQQQRQQQQQPGMVVEMVMMSMMWKCQMSMVLLMIMNMIH